MPSLSRSPMCLQKFIENVTPAMEEHRCSVHKAGDATVYELFVLGPAESVVGSLIWSRSEGTWNYETSDPLISEFLERVMGEGASSKHAGVAD